MTNMNKKIAVTISIGSILFGVYVIVAHGAARGGEGVLTILGLWGMPLTLLAENILIATKADWLNPWIYCVFYFLQYQLIALFFLKWKKKSK